jgi:DNA-binding transcriptional LysR family regulator
VAVEGFSLALVWHERTHDHAAHRWIRDALAEWAKPASGAAAHSKRHRRA